MKKSILILASAVAANCAVAELVINENLSVAGFVDMSAAYDRHEIDPAYDESDNHFAVDQVEVDFLLNFQPVTAQIELVAWDLDDVQIQQAFATYNFNDQFSLVAGRFFSGLGLEAKKPTGRYQYSGAYASGVSRLLEDEAELDDMDLDDLFYFIGSLDPAELGTALGVIIMSGDPISNSVGHGVKVNFAGNGFSTYLAVKDGVLLADGRLDGPGDSDWGIEGGVGFEPTAGLNLFAGAAHERGDFGGFDYDYTRINLHASQMIESLLLGAELNYDRLDIGGVSVNGWSGLVMANYAFTDQISLTGRISHVRVSDADLKAWKYTVAPSYAWTDNLLTRLEVSHERTEIFAGDYRNWLVALQQVFSF